MASPNKRASMREGPLASLFRRTDEAARDAEQAGAHAGDAAPAAAAPAPATPAARVWPHVEDSGVAVAMSRA